MTTYSMVTVQATAMPEATLCERHYNMPAMREAAQERAKAAEDWSGVPFWYDSTNNDQVACNVCGTEPHDGYDLDLHTTGDGWMGTFARIIRITVADLIETSEDSPSIPLPAEVTLYDGTVLTGKVDAWQGDYTFTVTPEGERYGRIVEVDDVRRFRA